MSRFLSSIAITAIASAGLLGTAQAEVVTFTLSGTIDVGFDMLGVFGARNGDLAGLQFTQTISTNLSGYSLNSTYHSLAYQNNNATFWGSTRVGNGPAYNWSVSGVVGQYTLNDYLSANVYAYRDLLTLSAGGGGLQGHTPDGKLLNAQNVLYSTSSPFLPSIDPHQTLSFTTNAAQFSEGYFHLSTGPGYYQTTFFDSGNGVATVSLNPVPEPETWAMMVAGLGMLGFLAKRRHAASAA